MLLQNIPVVRYLVECGAEVGKPADKNGLVRIREDSSIFVIKLEVCIVINVM